MSLNKWFPKGTKEDIATKEKIFFRLHYVRELYGQGKSRRMAFYTDRKKLQKDFDKLVSKDITITGVYKFDLSDGTTYDKAMLNASNQIEIFNENSYTLVG